jgi:hypothetical protein
MWQSKILSIKRFWIFYRRIKKYLLQNIKLDDKMRTSMMNMGPLERYQFQFALDVFCLLLRKMKK